MVATPPPHNIRWKAGRSRGSSVVLPTLSASSCLPFLSSHQKVFHEMYAIHGPHPDLNPAPLAVGNKVWGDVTLADAQGGHAECLKVTA